MRHQPPSASPGHQRGVVLIVSLVFLMLMTLIGVTGIQTTAIEERMSGNHRDRNLALLAAEAALREGEYNARKASTGTLSGMLTDEEPDPLDDEDWDGQHVYTKDLAGIPEGHEPVYVIEQLLELSDASELGETSGLFRITSRGYGGKDGTVVVLQSLVLRKN